MFVQVKSSQGLRLQYNWREFRLYLQLEEQWRDDTVGLCGTFNGNIQDDFLWVSLCFLLSFSLLSVFNLFSNISSICKWILLMCYSSAPSGMIESTPYLFANAWRVSSACVPRPSLPQLDPCDTHQQAGGTFNLLCVTFLSFRFWGDLYGLNVCLCDFSRLCSGEVWCADTRDVFCLSWVCKSGGFPATVSCRRLQMWSAVPLLHPRSLRPHMQETRGHHWVPLTPAWVWSVYYTCIHYHSKV